jgi:hypothetical protein
MDIHNHSQGHNLVRDSLSECRNLDVAIGGGAELYKGPDVARRCFEPRILVDSSTRLLCDAMTVTECCSASGRDKQLQASATITSNGRPLAAS